MVRSAFHAAAAAFLLFLFPNLLCAQSEPPQHPPRPKYVGPAKWNPSAQEVSVAYWTLEPGWSTVLEMRNNVTHHDLTVTPVLRASTGEETPLTPVIITPQHVVSLDLRNAAAASSKTLGPFGSVVFRFDGLYPDNLFAATIVRREGEPIDFHFDGQENGPNYNSGGIEGMWWLPAASSTDYLILSNPLKKTVTGTLALTSSFASHRPAALSLGPGETKRINLGEVLGPSSIGAVGGLSLSLPGKELISATQIVFDEVTGLAVMMKMFDREPDDQPKSRVLLAPMMALSQPDQGLGFPNGTQLLPRILLRNAGPASTQISATVDWRNQSSGTFAFPGLTLSPGEVRIISLADYQQAGQIPPDATWGTLKLSYTGRRADLVAVAVSYDTTNRYGLQTPFSEDLSRMWAGGMWHVDPTHNTFITTGNAGAEATAAEATLFYNGGKSKYRIEKVLSPGQQLWLDVGHLVHDQIPDSDGHTLPPDTMTGSYELRDLDHAYVGQLYEGKLVIDKTYGHAAYGCGSCCGYDGVAFNPTSFTGPVNIDGGETINAADTCTGGIVNVTGDANDWGSSDTAVATLSKATVHTVAVGSATGSTQAKLQWAHPPACPQTTFGPTQPVSVMSCDDPVPTSETTVYAGLTYTTEGSFIMTLNPSASCNFNGHNVQESNYATGTDNCYWPGANITNPPSVEGSTFLVGSGTGISNNQYGIDSIGFPSTGVNYIQQNAEEHDVDFPCVVTFYQQMSFEIDANTYQGYAQNVDTQTIGGNTVKVCRAGVCTGTIPF
jgi:hypothetical protein